MIKKKYERKDNTFTQTSRRREDSAEPGYPKGGVTLSRGKNL